MAQAGSRKSARQHAARPSSATPKYVYSFAGGKAEGSSAMRDLLGGKGCELAEMTKMGVPVPPGFTITTEAWAAYDAAGKKHPTGLWTQVMAAPGPPRGRRGQPTGRSGAAAAGLGPVRGARLDAGHDGHRPEPGAQRQVGRGARGADPERALRLGLLPPLHHALRGRGALHRSARPGRASRDREDARGGQDGCRPSARGAAGAGRGAEEGRAGQDGPAVPAGSARAAPAGHQRGLRVLVGQEGGGLPAHPSPARRLGHRGDRHGDGLRQSRADLGDRGVLLARSLERRAALLRRVPRQRPG